MCFAIPFTNSYFFVGAPSLCC